MAIASPNFLRPENILKLREEAPLQQIVINGRTYALGTASAEDCARIDAIGTRVANGTASGDDLWPLHILKALLIAGDPNVNLGAIRDIPPEAVVAATKEFMRQRVVAALDPKAAAGRA